MERGKVERKERVGHGENAKAKARDRGGSSSVSEQLSEDLQMLGSFRQRLGALSPEGGENVFLHILL